MQKIIGVTNLNSQAEVNFNDENVQFKFDSKPHIVARCQYLNLLAFGDFYSAILSIFERLPSV
jgi:hypothetical protein